VIRSNCMTSSFYAHLQLMATAAWAVMI